MASSLRWRDATTARTCCGNVDWSVMQREGGWNRIQLQPVSLKAFCGIKDSNHAVDE